MSDERQYRLTDWLGGHEVTKWIPFGDDLVQVQSPAAPNPHGWLVLSADALVEVKPPSIDDEVDLPLRVVDSYGDGLEIHGYKENEDAVAYVQRFGRAGLTGSPVDLTAEQCRAAARALWLVGTREAS